MGRVDARCRWCGWCCVTCSVGHRRAVTRSLRCSCSSRQKCNIMPRGVPPTTRIPTNRRLLRGNPPRLSPPPRSLTTRLHLLQRLYPLARAPSAPPSRHYTTTMALNASSHNITGESTGPTTTAPPPLGDDTKKDILAHANAEGTGQSAPGQAVPEQGGKDVAAKPKTAKELEKERKKAEKDAKVRFLVQGRHVPDIDALHMPVLATRLTLYSSSRSKPKLLRPSLANLPRPRKRRRRRRRPSFHPTSNRPLPAKRRSWAVSKTPTGQHTSPLPSRVLGAHGGRRKASSNPSTTTPAIKTERSATRAHSSSQFLLPTSPASCTLATRSRRRCRIC